MRDKIKHDKKCEADLAGEETLYGRICGCVQREKTRFRLALKEIKEKQGKVCENFEVCTHESCKSSYTSWAIADEALNELNRNS